MPLTFDSTKGLAYQKHDKLYENALIFLDKDNKYMNPVNVTIYRVKLLEAKPSHLDTIC